MAPVHYDTDSAVANDLYIIKGVSAKVADEAGDSQPVAFTINLSNPQPLKLPPLM